MSRQFNSDEQRADDGMTLIELLVSVMILGVLATAISTSIIVTFRTSGASEGRLNVARAEQNVATWLPADLASAVDADDTPDKSACADPSCGGLPLNGSNALLLNWPSSNGSGDITVSYVYRVAADGETYELLRVECTNGVSCKRNTVLRDLEGPQPTSLFQPGVTPVPDDVINVTVPLAADAIEDTAANEDTGSTARRIVVTINGGGETEGAGGGVNRVSITAGGTALGDLVPEKVTGPSFTQARSRCGGPITIIVDDSGSIASSGGTADTENAVRGFVSALAGTPTQVQVVRFAREASVIGAGSDWNKYYDMTLPGDVTTLVGPGGNSGLIGSELVQSGGTNWEDAMFRTFYAETLNADGTPARLDADGNPATVLPGLVVFFTDGQPTFNRTDYRGGGVALPSVPAVEGPLWPDSNGNTFDQEGFNRAEYLIEAFRNTDDVRMVGVGVGGISTGQVYAFTQDNVDDYTYGIGYYSGRAYWATNAAKTSGYYLNENQTSEKVLGNFIAGGKLQATGDKPYVKSSWDGSTWSDAEIADMFITNDFSALPAALSTIALGQCGGTLTLQTELPDGSPAPSDVTYESNGETVTTSAITRAAAFDITLPGAAAATTTVTPQSFAESGYNPVGWSCQSKGANFTGWSLVDPVDPGQGIDVTVSANEAVSCTLEVSTT